MSSTGEDCDPHSIRADRDVLYTRAGRDAVVVQDGAHYHAGVASGSQDARRDSFRPSFHVPSNPREVVLDFGNTSEYTQPQTQEARVLQEILRDDCKKCGTRVIAIHGKGGVGKSCLLRALAKHEEVKERFPGGVYFLSLGMDAGIDKLIEGLIQIVVISGGQRLAKELRRVDNFQVLLERLREWMKGKKCLLLLDDAWERNELGSRVVRDLAEIFSSGSGSVVALTTRFVSIAIHGVEIELQPQETTSKRAEAILLRHAKFEREEIEDERTRKVCVMLLKMCGGLPLFLSVIGRAIAELCVELKIERELVLGEYWKMIEGQEDGILLQTESDEYPDLGKTLSVSLEILCNGRGKRLGSLSMSGYSLFEMHRALSVFKKQTAIPISVCRVLWNVKSDEAAKQIGKGFADVGLGDIEIERVGERSVMFMRLHDLVHIFAIDCAKERNEIAIWHERLLAGYIPKTGGEESVRRWWEVEEKSGEEYLFGDLCRHLESSGNTRELVGLLLSGEWTIFRQKQGLLSSWKHDFSQYLRRETIVASSEDEEIENGLRMVRDAVEQSWVFVREKPQDLGFQIFGRLVDCKNSFVGKYLESIEKVLRRPWLKPMQRLWTLPGERGMIAELDLSDCLKDSLSDTRFNICDIAVHKDPFVAAVAVEKVIAIIDLKEMTVISRCIGHTNRVLKVGISANEKQVFSWSFDGTVRQWDVQSGREDTAKCIRLIEKETCAAFCIDKSFVVTGSEQGSVAVWDLCSGERRACMKVSTKRVSGIGVSPNGQIIVTGIEGGALQLWDVQTFRPLGTELKGHLNSVIKIAFSPDGRFVASGDRRDYRIGLWDVESRTHVSEPFPRVGALSLSGGMGRPFSVSFSEDGQQIISSHRGGLIIVWDTAQPVRSWRAHSGSHWVVCVAMTGDNGRACAMSGGDGGKVRVWDLQAASEELVVGTRDLQAGGNVSDERIRHDERVYSVTASPDGRIFFSKGWDDTLLAWNTVDGTVLAGPLFVGDRVSFTCMAVSTDSQRVVAGSSCGAIYVWEVATGVQLGIAARGHEDSVRCVAFSGDGRFVVSGSDDRTVRVWMVIQNPELGESSSESLTNQVRRTDSGFLEVLPCQKFIRLEMFWTHRLPFIWGYQWPSVESVIVSRDGRRVLSVLSCGEIWVWDMSSGICIYLTQFGHCGQVREIQISEKNVVVVKFSWGKVLRWQLNEGGSLTRVLEDEDETGVVQAELPEGSVSPEPNSIVCCDRFVHLRGSGMEIAKLPGGGVLPRAWKYDAERRVLCAGLDDGRVLFFRLECGGMH